jgi:hypothetical protein
MDGLVMNVKNGTARSVSACLNLINGTNVKNVGFNHH